MPLLVMFGLSVESLLENRATQSIAGQRKEKESSKTFAQLICVSMLLIWGIVGALEVILLHTQMS